MRKSIRELKRLSNFVAINSREGDTLDEKVEIINRVLFGPDKRHWKRVNPLRKFIGYQRLMLNNADYPANKNSRLELARVASGQLANVIDYLTGEINARPNSLAVYEPAEVLRAYIAGDDEPEIEPIPPRKSPAEATNDLSRAISHWNLEAAKQAIADGADVNNTDENGITMLMRALACRTRSYGGGSIPNYKMVELLIDNGADVNAVDKKGNTILMQALSGDNSPCVEKILKAGADVELGNIKTGKTPLMKAVEYCQYYNTRTLLKHGANVLVKTKGGKDLVDVVRFSWKRNSSRKSMVELLEDYMLEQATPEEAKRLKLKFDLYDAGRDAESDKIKLLIEEGADATQKIGDLEENLFDLTVLRGDLDLAQFILDHCPNVDINSPHLFKKETLLSVAVNRGTSPKVIDFLLKHGANPNVRDADDSTPLWTASILAARTGEPAYLEIVNMLIDAGANVNVTDKEGRTLAGDMLLGQRGFTSDTCERAQNIYDILIKHGAKAPDEDEWNKY